MQSLKFLKKLVKTIYPGDDMEISDYTGDFSTEMLETSTIYLLAAGTGTYINISIDIKEVLKCLSVCRLSLQVSHLM